MIIRVPILIMVLLKLINAVLELTH